MRSVPLTGRSIPVIADDYVDPAFGTGCVKITPAHDFNDWAVGQRHKLTPVEMLTLDAKVKGTQYSGLDRFEARTRILADLKAQGLLVSEKPYKLRVPRSGRTGVIVEPMLTDQWFVKMDSLANAGLEAVASGRVKFFPEYWASTYNEWLTNIQDWCISRQLWWGHQIPVWYDDAGRIYVARSEAEALAKAGGAKLRRDEDVLDTWFSSALVPFTSLGWPEKTKDLEVFLPSSVLITQESPSQSAKQPALRSRQPEPTTTASTTRASVARIRTSTCRLVLHRACQAKARAKSACEGRPAHMRADRGGRPCTRKGLLTAVIRC